VARDEIGEVPSECPRIIELKPSAHLEHYRFLKIRSRSCIGQSLLRRQNAADSSIAKLAAGLLFLIELSQFPHAITDALCKISRAEHLA
jgi:hypothetical protein